VRLEDRVIAVLAALLTGVALLCHIGALTHVSAGLRRSGSS